MRTQVELENAVAAELAGSKDAVLRALGGHLDCDVFLRGNVLTLDGEEAAVDAAARGARAVGADRAGPRDRARHDRGGRRARSTRTSRRREILEDVVWRHRGQQGRAEDRQPEALRRLDPQQHDHVRRSGRPAPARRSWRWRWRRPRSAAREVNRIILTRPAVEAGERLGLPARRPDGEGRSRTCARCSTRCTTCSTPSRSPSTSSGA